jgi:hypothetical protein
LVAAKKDDAVFRIEAVHLDQHMVEGLLALRRGRRRIRRRGPADRIQFVDEDDAGAFLRPCSNRSLTRLAPTPTNNSTKSEPT